MKGDRMTMWGQKHGMNSRGVAHTEPRVARPIISFGTRHTARMRSFGSHFEAHVRRSSSVAPSRRIAPAWRTRDDIPGPEQTTETRETREAA